MSVDTAVAVADVSKRFRLYHERPSSLKERVVSRRGSRYEEFWAVKDVSLEIAKGETFGLIGANGSGKSTLLKCIAGILRPERGKIAVNGRLASLLELGAGFHPDLTGRENVYLNASILGLTRKETDHHFPSIVEFAELEQFIDMQVKHYSSGMYVRLGFAVAIHVDPEILIIDEVLAVGDEAFQRKCIDRISQYRREGKTIVFVTHAVDLVRQICTRAAYLDHGDMLDIGDPDTVIRRFRKTLHGEATLVGEAMEEHGTREVQIEKVTLSDGNGQDRTVFHPGDDLLVSVDLHSDKPVSDWKVGVAVFDERGDLSFGTNTHLRHVDLGTIDGGATTRFKFGALPIRQGRYEITVGVTTKDDTVVYHWQEKSYFLRCEPLGPDVGRVEVPIEIGVERL